MKEQSEARLLRIFIGETDKISHVPVYEKIVSEAKSLHLAGATVYKGIMGFGGSSIIHTRKIFELSDDLPLVIEIVDDEKKIDSFIPIIERIFEEANCGGLFTIEKATIVKYNATVKKED